MDVMFHPGQEESNSSCLVAQLQMHITSLGMSLLAFIQGISYFSLQ